MTSESTRHFAGRVHSTRKRSGGRRNNDGLPASTSEQIHALETTVQQLAAQLHEERLQAILDLRIAGGLVTQKERSESYDSLARLPDEALDMIRGDLVKIFSRINAANRPATSTSARSAAYVA